MARSLRRGSNVQRARATRPARKEMRFGLSSERTEDRRHSSYEVLGLGFLASRIRAAYVVDAPKCVPSSACAQTCRVGAVSGLRLLAGLHAHLVLYFPHAAHALCHFHGFVDLRLARDKPAQLDHGLVGFHLDV